VRKCRGVRPLLDGDGVDLPGSAVGCRIVLLLLFCQQPPRQVSQAHAATARVINGADSASFNFITALPRLCLSMCHDSRNVGSSCVHFAQNLEYPSSREVPPACSNHASAQATQQRRSSARRAARKIYFGELLEKVVQTVFAPPLLHCACLERVPAMMFASVHGQQRACHLRFHKTGRRRALSRATRRMRCRLARGAVWSKRETHMRSAQCFILTEADGAFRGFSDRNWRHQEHRDRRNTHERRWSMRCRHSNRARKAGLAHTETNARAFSSNMAPLVGIGYRAALSVHEYTPQSELAAHWACSWDNRTSRPHTHTLSLWT
jgi:hypothetical protein